MVTPLQTDAVLAWLAQVLVWTGALKFHFCKLCPQTTVFLKDTLRIVFGSSSENGSKQELYDQTHTTLCMQRVTGLDKSFRKP